MRIGILGGSFDPIHKGHIYMASEAFRLGGLDEVWLIPNGNAPHKDTSRMADAGHRLAMCQLAIKDSAYDFLRVNDIEIESQEYCYTYRTLELLTKAYPEHEFFFIMGADSLDYFDKWRHPEIIAALCEIYVINRDEFTQGEMERKITQIKSLFSANIHILQSKKYDVSSTEIRNGKNREELTDSVKRYIEQHKLYS